MNFSEIYIPPTGSDEIKTITTVYDSEILGNVTIQSRRISTEPEAPIITYVHPNYGTDVDEISPNVKLTRPVDGGALYNAATETDYDRPTSPHDVVFNKQGWTNLALVDQRKYVNIADVFEGYPLNHLNEEMIMKIVSENRYFKVKFLSWTKGPVGGGWSYQRQEFNPADYRGGIANAGVVNSDVINAKGINTQTLTVTKDDFRAISIKGLDWNGVTPVNSAISLARNGGANMEFYLPGNGGKFELVHGVNSTEFNLNMVSLPGAPNLVKTWWLGMWHSPSDGVINIHKQGVTKMQVAENSINVLTTLNLGYVVEYADNAAALAAGLRSGDVYRTGDLLKIVHP